MRRSKTVDGETTLHVWIGDDIAADMGANSAAYVQGVRLVWSDYGYYLYNAHGDVVQLIDEGCEATRGYDYDAFGNPKQADEDDLNPYRYSGEYTDLESGYSYLRARYYDPEIGRFITADSHWNVGNMLYGDDPIKFGGVYVPMIAAMLQSGNLYVYCMNNPLLYFDSDGAFALSNKAKVIIGAVALTAAVALTVATGGGAAVVAAGVAKVVGSVALSTAVSAGLGYLENGKQGAIDGAANGFMFASLSVAGGAAVKYAKAAKAAKAERAANVLAQNRANGRAFEQQEFAKFSSQNKNAVEQITIKTSSGTKTRVDAIGLDSNGNVVINEFKSSITAPLTKNQAKAFPEIFESGGTVVGKGKGIFTNGYQIPKRTNINIIRPK